MNLNQVIEYEKMEKFILVELGELFIEIDQKINYSEFSDKIKKEMRGKIAFAICQQ